MNSLRIESDFKSSSLNRACAYNDNIDNVNVSTNTWTFRSRSNEMTDRFEKRLIRLVLYFCLSSSLENEIIREIRYRRLTQGHFLHATHLTLARRRFSALFNGNTIRFNQNDPDRCEMGVFSIFHPSPGIPSEQ